MMRVAEKPTMLLKAKEVKRINVGKLKYENNLNKFELKNEIDQTD